jgi:hypothetical protein
MNNDIAFQKIKYNLTNLYHIENPLPELQVSENKLIFRDKKILLKNVNLELLDINLFKINSEIIFSIIYLLESTNYTISLIQKETPLTEEETNFLESYIKMYLSVKNNWLETTEIDRNIIFYISKPEYLIDDPLYQNNMASMIFREKINDDISSRESSQHDSRLSLAHPYYRTNSDDNNTGKISLILIGAAIIPIISYIIYFILNS